MGCALAVVPRTAEILACETTGSSPRRPLFEKAELNQRRRTAAAEDGVDLLADGFERERLDHGAMRAGLQTVHRDRLVGLFADDQDADAGKFGDQLANQRGASLLQERNAKQHDMRREPANTLLIRLLGVLQLMRLDLVVQHE